MNMLVVYGPVLAFDNDGYIKLWKTWILVTVIWICWLLLSALWWEVAGMSSKLQVTWDDDRW